MHGRATAAAPTKRQTAFWFLKVVVRILTLIAATARLALGPATDILVVVVCLVAGGLAAWGLWDDIHDGLGHHAAS